MPSCEERIYSDDYYSALLDFWPLSEEISQLTKDYCYMKISSILGVLVISKRELAPLSFTDYTYRFLPKLYAPMQSVSFPLLKSGILQVQQPPLQLTGRNVIIGIADSGIDYSMLPFAERMAAAASSQSGTRRFPMEVFTAGREMPER